MLGKVPKAKPVCSKNVHGHKISIAGKGCPNPTPQQNCQQDSFGNQDCNGNNPNPGNTCDPNNDPNCFGQNPTPTDTGGGGGNGGFSGNTTNTPTATTAQAGVAVGSGLMILPASLVWTTVSRRQRRKKRAGRAE